jgi:hypothetical protein
VRFEISRWEKMRRKRGSEENGLNGLVLAAWRGGE